MPVSATRENAVTGVEGYTAEFARRQGENAGDPAWLQTMRREAIGRFAALGFPPLRREEWRLTTVAPVSQGTFHWPEGDPDTVAAGRIEPYLFAAAARLVFVDGRFAPRLSSV